MGHRKYLKLPFSEKLSTHIYSKPIADAQRGADGWDAVHFILLADGGTVPAAVKKHQKNRSDKKEKRIKRTHGACVV